jgi:thiamine pyrophosphate-dependent acetolactate synthase large subunit-like protein
VVGFAGDGGFLMSGQEIASAIKHGARKASQEHSRPGG